MRDNFTCALAAFGAFVLFAHGLEGSAQAPSSGIALVDSAGSIAGRPLSEALVLVTDKASGVVAPATIRSIYDADGRTISGSATWQANSSVLFASSDCTTGAHVFGTTNPGVRASAQVQTASGVILYVGDNGATTTVNVRSILYGSGCTPVIIQQNGVVPVVLTINLTATHPPPLSFR
jgi:hypothetical protein